MHVSNEQIQEAIAGLLDSRKATATICPSEAARVLAPKEWRTLMPRVREVAVAMAQANLLDIRQGGRNVGADRCVHGPIRLGRTNAIAPAHPTTLDGRYFVVRGRLWRMANPNLPGTVREALVKQLMDARRALRSPRSEELRREARVQVDRAKQALGERGPAWWTDGAPDFNRKLAKNTPYADWFLQLMNDGL